MPRLARLIPLCVSLLLASLDVAATRITRDEVPPELQGWIDWVLFHDKTNDCPFLYNNFNYHRCAWPTSLDLSLADEGGTFSITWDIYKDSWISLPGNDLNWPLEVHVDGNPATVTRHGGKPAVQAESGRHEISGHFQWRHLPEMLAIPADTGLVNLEINKNKIPFPDIDTAGNLWIRERDTGAKSSTSIGNRLDLQVYRRVIDEIPMEVLTVIVMEIAGLQREELLGEALLGGFIPLRLTSPLPARLEPDGRLRVQVRPGRWQIELSARYPTEVKTIELGTSQEPWPKEETWVFDARNHLRLVEIQGLTSIDPRQTQLPQAWQQLPAYLIKPGESMHMKTIRRGDPEPEPDQLTLERNLWLDFGGDGYTISDHISGTMTRNWRLEATAPLHLGSVVLDNQPQFITRLSGSDKAGVEVRRGHIELSADSRHDAGIRKLAVVGWDQDFQQVSATLHLPPGWRLFSARGIDNVPNTWLSRWTLLDIFLVLIAALAVAKLWSRPYGLLALITLTLTWHEPDAPRIVWLHILAAIALLRVLPVGQFHGLVKIYRNFALLTLVLFALPFMIDQVRTALYPQLERPWQPIYPPVATAGGAYDASVTAMAQRHTLEKEVIEAAPEMEFKSEIAASPEVSSLQAQEKRVPRRQKIEQKALDEIDPDAMVQTGPGQPDWQWNRITLNWNGPVERQQEMALFLLSPAVNLVLNLLRVLLIAALALLVLGFYFTPRRGLHRYATSVAGIFFLAPILLFSSTDTHANFPDPPLLDELKARLLAPPECLPDCAQSPHMNVQLTPDTLSIRMEVHAIEEISVPLPARTGLWVPEIVNIDGQHATGLFRDQDGGLWVHLDPGPHQVILSGALPSANTLQIPLPLKPHHADYQADGWQVEGIYEDGQPGDHLQFTRLKDNTAEEQLPALQASELPAFVRIERNLRLGLDWRVETRVTRASPRGTAIVLEIPLLPGESVTTEAVRVSDNRVLVNISPNDELITWESGLEKSAAITLTANNDPAWTEIWRADISPIWHLSHEGIPVVHHQDPNGRWLPEWRPWPGETVTLVITRPVGVEGQTLTIDKTQILTTPGKRATDSDVTLTLRSSRGGQHTITLPADASLQSVTINGTAQPVRQKERTVTLPLTPGTQTVVLSLRNKTGIVSFFSTPEIDLGTPSVNNSINVKLGNERWILLTGGPELGPAVLFWGVLLVIILIAAGLGRVELTPLRTRHWVLLGIGLTQTPVWAGVIIVGWLFALGMRTRINQDMNWQIFNCMQVGLFLLTLLALAMLFEAVKHGLLGYPEMQISGNNSTAYNLNWYQDRSSAVLPRAWVFSVPVMVYRLLMLAWAMWLSFSLLKWLRWGWGCYSSNGFWKPRPKIEKASKAGT